MSIKSTEVNRKTLKASGLRATNQRALVLDIIRHGAGHIDADEVYRRARTKQPTLSLSTVYRTLQALKKLGLVEELHFDEYNHHYQMKPFSEHHHLLCLGCRIVVDSQYSVARHVKQNVAAAKDFEIVSTEVRMAGYCPECQQKR